MDELYFGHPLSTFDSELEEELMAKIDEEFPEYAIENPNQPRHKQNYEEWAEDGSGMDYYFEEVLPAMDAGVFLPFEDGSYGAGTAGEAEFLADRDRPVYEIDYTGVIRELDIDEMDVLSVEETRNRLD